MAMRFFLFTAMVHFGSKGKDYMEVKNETEIYKKALEIIIGACHPHSGSQKFHIGQMAEAALKAGVESRLGIDKPTGGNLS